MFSLVLCHGVKYKVISKIATEFDRSTNCYYNTVSILNPEGGGEAGKSSNNDIRMASNALVYTWDMVKLTLERIRSIQIEQLVR